MIKHFHVNVIDLIIFEIVQYNSTYEIRIVSNY